MKKRFVSIWLHHWPSDRWRRHAQSDPGPLVLTATGQGGIRLTAVDADAAAAGLAPGMTFADAQTLVPHLHAVPADPEADAVALRELAEWLGRFTPVTAVDGADGILLDATGCPHLWGGETGYLAVIADSLARLRLTARIGLADTPAMAWAWTHYGQQDGSIRGAIVPAGRSLEHLSPLPIAALRLPAGLIADLIRVGLRFARDLLALPRAPLIARYGEAPTRRLDLALGHEREPITPLRPPIPWRTERAFAEPISRHEDIEAVARMLLIELCRLLDGAGRGARRLDLAFHRVDGTVPRLAVGASRPSRDPTHLMRLFLEGFGRIDPGFGIDRVVLTAPAVDRLDPIQATFDGAGATGGDFAQLIDRLSARLGAAHVRQPVPYGSHMPERAAILGRLDISGAAVDWGESGPRPVMLFAEPEPVEVIAPLPDHPPVLFTWRRQRHRVARADGPERIEPEWWRGDAMRPRDYYRVEDEHGRRFWLFRHGLYPAAEPPAWYMHGLFA